MPKLTQEYFINAAKEIHKNKYDYSLVDYVNSHTKVKIICPIHGIFEQLPYVHLNQSSGCNRCGIELKAKNLSLTTQQFVDKSNQVHKNKYDYSLSEYKNNSTKIKIICPIHGIFEQKPMSHIAGNGCSKCGGTGKLSTSEFIKRSEKIHGNKYDYSLVKYINMEDEVKIICPIHGIFEKKPIKHIFFKSGCPKCNQSKGENTVELFLNINNIKFIKQKTFEDCKSISKLPFDFYLPNHNICIEFDGEQHFRPRERFGGTDALILLQVRDRIKTKYCQDNNIKLIRIRYNENITNKLKSELSI